MSDGVGNELDELHCFQACFRMVLGALTGEEVSLEESERLTGFVPGKLSWPLAGMLSLADRGLTVILLEDFEAQAFVDDPLAEFRRQYGSQKEVDRAASEIDLELERQRARRCLQHPQVHFVAKAPTLADIDGVLGNSGARCIAHCNYRELVERDGYVGHYVVVKGVAADTVRIDDPGLPARSDWDLDIGPFEEATGFRRNGGSVVAVTRA